MPTPSRSSKSAFAQSATQPNRVALAKAYLLARQLDKAIPLLDQAVAAEPDNYDLRMMYALALRDRKQFPAAAAQFLQAARIHPQEAQTWTDLGGMLYMTGSYPQSLAAFDRRESWARTHRATGSSVRSF